MNAQDEVLVKTIAPALHVAAALGAAGAYTMVMFVGVKILSRWIGDSE
jgi:hypothetical protein